MKNKWLTKIKVLMKDRSQMIFVIGLVGFILWTIASTQLKNLADRQVAAAASPESPDTVIPKGFVLVPIELKNAESLSALIENFAIVDLYVASGSGKAHGQKVGHHLRLLRAPLNPNTFAVLVPDNQAESIINGSGPLMAVLQNREQAGHGAIEKNQKKLSHVQYYLGG